MLQQIEKKVTKTKTETLLKQRAELDAIIKDSKKALDTINDELFIRITATPERKLQIGDKTAQIVKRVNFTNVPLEFAKKYRAVKKVVDTSILKPFYEKGIEMPGVTATEYILVK